MTVEHRLVHVAGIRLAHDHIPVHFLGKHLKRARHVVHGRELGGVMMVVGAKHQAVLVAHHIPHLDVASRGQQRAIEIVGYIVEGVVVAVDLSARLEQLHLVGKTTLGKHLDGVFGGSLMAVEHHVGVDNLLHALANVNDVLVGNWLATLLAQVAVVATRDGVLDKEFAARDHIACRLVEHKA